MNDDANLGNRIFCDALALPLQERDAYLDVACEGTLELRKQVEELLASSPTERDGAAVLPEVAPREIRLSEGPGTVIGRYKLLQKLGEGGMGVVYMAEQQEPVVRKVALKIIKLGMDTRQVVARFQVERQALALMEHPNIAKVFDAGATDAGRPYFVMELVQRFPITRFCDEAELETPQRLELFAQICSAIQHAHEKGVIHRDIKPSNVLVTLVGGQPVPKVIDFGIAKSTQQRLTQKTLVTQFPQLIGTPAYMSPEQASLSGLDIDARSDIYALGVLLYQLLTGNTPFDTRALLSAGFEEIRRIIREVEPPKPSTRLSTMQGQELVELARQRRTDPRKLVLVMRGDLDCIVMKALEKDRTRRYETATGLAAVICRFLRHEPVRAVAPNARYKLCKFVQRNRTRVIATAATVVLFTGGITTSTWLALIATRPRNNETQVIQQQQRQPPEKETAKQAESPQRQATEEGLDRTQTRTAEKSLATDEASPGVAFPAQVVRTNPSNRVASAQPALDPVEKSFPAPLTEPLRHEGAVLLAKSGPDQRPVVTGGVLVLKGPSTQPFPEALSGFQQAYPGGTLIDKRELSRRVQDDRPALLVAFGREQAEMARQQAGDTPLIVVMVSNPAAFGLTGKNVAGITTALPGDLQLRLFADLLPNYKSIALIHNPARSGRVVTEAQAEAKKLGVHLEDVPINSPREVRDRFNLVKPIVNSVWVTHCAKSFVTRGGG
jgi:serine/threonine protein kinase